ncbi:hypothetical protein DFA_06006 [Cavenderia fasciculata]|uniref:Uncharacterized protein n=1 Tax=Cavenderia fasciculata TaxID=261658 RepID=F4PJU4_CACFS|nr:hypothetical protein DFA_06006 [Cavenderia fasciculata]EGG23868.1 hypothetical protein DFA_06006 [Cavenderia fasciculata]|eukprot:XP_004361719.1 hypothetical protein DFA_06006 [Cavenderia fasciculata]
MSKSSIQVCMTDQLCFAATRYGINSTL